MSPVRPKFLPVLREDMERVGTSEAAHLLALIRYVTGLTGESNGRLWIRGEMYWQATYLEIADALGGDWNNQKVGRVIRYLDKLGELSIRKPSAWDGNQTKAYRVTDQPMFISERDSGGASDMNGPASNMNGPASNMNRPPFKYEHSSSSVEELNEEVEEVDYRASQAIARREDTEIIDAEVIPEEADFMASLQARADKAQRYVALKYGRAR